ncbi:hypothetical protein QSH57_004314 [Fusarium oxysporum f. sp. vasinfectum]|nr:hypothetical protein QSH57_004314 [Fusarium oxysporum f. sp. vasinfectum]
MTSQALPVRPLFQNIIHYNSTKATESSAFLLYQLPRVSGPDTRFDGPCPLVLGPDTRNHGPCTPRTPSPTVQNHGGLAAVRRSLYSSKDKLAKDLEKAQECLIDVEESTATEEEIVSDLEGVYKKHPGDNKLCAFLDGRKKTVIEYQKVYIIVKSQLGKSSAELSKTQSEIQLVNRRLGQLEAERAEVMKEKEGADKVIKSMMLMSQFMERGWQASVDSFGQAFGGEAVQTAF